MQACAGGHDALRPNDPVPVLGLQAWAKAVSGITSFCHHVHAPIPRWAFSYPKQHCESGSLFRHLQCLSAFLGRFQYMGIVDKGAGST